MKIEIADLERLMNKLTPLTLAAIIVDLDGELVNLTQDEARLKHFAESALICNVGEDDAAEMKQYYKQSI